MHVCALCTVWDNCNFYGFKLHLVMQVTLRGGRSILAGRFAFLERQAQHNGVAIVSVMKGGFDGTAISFKARLQTMQDGDGSAELLAIQQAHARMQACNGGGHCTLAQEVLPLPMVRSCEDHVRSLFPTPLLLVLGDC